MSASIVVVDGLIQPVHDSIRTKILLRKEVFEALLVNWLPVQIKSCSLYSRMREKTPSHLRIEIVSNIVFLGALRISFNPGDDLEYVPMVLQEFVGPHWPDIADSRCVIAAAKNRKVDELLHRQLAVLQKTLEGDLLYVF